MLVQHCQPTHEQLIESLSMQIQLTDELQKSLNLHRGITSTNPFELRGAARFRCNGTGVVLALPESFTMPGQERSSLVIIRDISRKGVGLVSHQQWYPEQLVELRLQEATMQTKIARVRRLGPLCYEVGLMIMKHLNHFDETY
jgi:hypothetical protein